MRIRAAVAVVALGLLVGCASAPKADLKEAQLRSLAKWYSFSTDPIVANAKPVPAPGLDLKLSMFVLGSPKLDILKEDKGEAIHLQPLDQTRSRIIEEMIRSNAAEPLISPAVLSLAGTEGTVSIEQHEAPDPAQPTVMKVVRGVNFRFQGDSDGKDGALLSRLDITTTTDGVPSELHLAPQVNPGIYLVSKPVAWLDAKPALVLVRFEALNPKATAPAKEQAAAGN